MKSRKAVNFFVCDPLDDDLQMSTQRLQPFSIILYFFYVEDHFAMIVAVKRINVR